MTDLGKGPKGGNLNLGYNPSKPEWRIASFTGEADGSLHTFEKPDVAVAGKKNEQPWHRMAAYMLNAGRTNSEIALAADVSVGSVSDLRGQRWFQELCATIANRNGEEILGAINAEALNSVNKLVELRDHAEKESVQLSAAISLLEHAKGKAVQSVITDTTHRMGTPTEEMSALQEELASLRRVREVKAITT